MNQESITVLASMITRCTVSNNAWQGLAVVGNSTLITGNSVRQNGTYGIVGGGLVSNNSVVGNALGGIAGAGSAVNNFVQ